MSAGIRPTLATTSSSSVEATIQRPPFTVGAPFVRDGARWIPLGFIVNNETCGFEATFPIDDQGLNEYETQIMSHPLNEIIKGLYCLTRFAPSRADGRWVICSSQSIFCLPFGYEGREAPQNFADFQELAFNTLEALQPGFKAIVGQSVHEINVPNRKYFGLRVNIEPTVTVVEHPKELVMVEGRQMTQSTTVAKERNGFLIHVYATQNALYVLANKKSAKSSTVGDAVNAEAFVSSFKLNQ